jgi:acyl carrier protein
MNAELSLAKQRSSSGNTNKSNPLDVSSKLLATLAEELMIDVSEISDASGFLALGLDSILAVTWIRKINHIFDLNLPATVVYKHPTVGAFIAHIKDLSVNLVAEEVNPGLLSNTESNIYWTSTTLVNSPTSVLNVSFYSGSSNNLTKLNNNYYVRCVSGP